MAFFVGLITLAVALSLGSGTASSGGTPESFSPNETERNQRQDKPSRNNDRPSAS